ncbi:MAG: glycosyltransferase family 2 protein [Patescibacteria group bacterium]
MNKNDKISVVMPARDSGGTIRATIESILNQTLKPYEVIIIASKNDNTRKAIGDYLYNNSVKYFELDNLQEYYRDAHIKRWHGAQKSKGNFIFFTDSKAILDEKALSNSLKLAKEHNVEVVAGTVLSWAEDTNSFISKVQDKGLIRNNPKFPKVGKLNKNNFGLTESLPVTTALFVSRNAFDKIEHDFGLEYSKIASTYDDYVTAWLLVNEGFEILVTNTVISYHKHRTSWKNYLKQISRSGQSAALMAKYYPECPYAQLQLAGNLRL